MNTTDSKNATLVIITRPFLAFSARPGARTCARKLASLVGSSNRVNRQWIASEKPTCLFLSPPWERAIGGAVDNARGCVSLFLGESEAAGLRVFRVAVEARFVYESVDGSSCATLC